MTRKGLALGAGVALVASGFVAAPAQAIGVDGSVTLRPLTGTEYAVLSNNYYFNLTSTFVEQGAGKYLKFYVSDPASVVTPVDASSSQYVATPSGWSNAAAVITVSFSTPVNFKNGDKVTFAGLASSDAGAAALANGLRTLTSVASDKLSVTFTSTGTPAGTNRTVSSPTASLTTEGQLTRLASADAGTVDGWTYGAGDWVYDTRSSSNSTDKNLRIIAAATDATKSVVVTSWVDSNDNNKIDSTESRSPSRTVSFVKPSELTVTTTLAPIVGDDYLDASVTTNPVLNGNQLLLQDVDAINAAFTRQGSTATRYAVAHWGGSSQTSVWNDTTKVFSVKVGLLVTGGGNNTSQDAATTAAGTTDAAWTDLSAPASQTGVTSFTYSSTTEVVTVGVTAHNLRVGDVLNFANSGSTDLDANNVTVASVPSADTFTFAFDKDDDTTFDTTVANIDYVIATYTETTQKSDQGVGALGNVALVDRVFPGTYTAKATVLGTAYGNTASNTPVAVAAKTVKIATTGTAAIQGRVGSGATANAVVIKTGTTSVPMTVTVLDEDEAAVSAGRPVVVSAGNTLVTAPAGENTTSTGTFRIDGKSGPVTLTTDANGQVKFTLTETAGAATARTRVVVTAEGAVTSGVDLNWQDQAFGLYDLATTGDALGATPVRRVAELGSYDLNLLVADQWYQAAPSATYRLAVSGEGVSPAIVTLTSGRATVKITDSGIDPDADSKLDTKIVVQKLTGTTWGADITSDLDTYPVKSFSVALGANGSTLYSANAVRTSAAVAEVALVENDRRLAFVEAPAYGTNKFVRLSGVIRNSTSNAPYEGAVVTVSGASNILFENGNVSKRGSLTFVAGTDGKFEVNLYSTTAQTDTVITFTSNGASSTTKVSFTGTGVGEGTKLEVTAPANVRPASTFQVKAKLTDVYGNAVDTAAGRVKVTYTGPGIVFGTLPDQTDKSGELSFSVLLGSNDTGNVVVTVSYDQNGDADYVDAKDLNTTKTITVGTGAAAGAGKVNVGSFNGKLVVYASGLSGKRISWKVGGNWGSQVASSNYAIFNRPTPRAGVTVSVDIYVDGVKTLTKSVVTR